jgi:hypothetical protein
MQRSLTTGCSEKSFSALLLELWRMSVMILNGGKDESTHHNYPDHHSEFLIFTCSTLAKTLGAS